MASTAPPPFSLPFPLHRISSQVERYMLYDINVISWLRRQHNILGVLIGTLPQLPSQNVFLGLPLELQPEEARLVVEKGLAFVVNDLERLRSDYGAQDYDNLQCIKDKLRKEREEVAKSIQRRKQSKTQKAFEKSKNRGKIEDPVEDSVNAVRGSTESPERPNAFFEGATQQEVPPKESTLSDPESWSITPSASTASYQNVEKSWILPKADPSSYALFGYLQGQGYFMTPGLRFGCRFSVYPGDPLRYHSHFLAISAKWDEDVDLLHLVGGGRLGTGVKKGWMIGGIENQANTEITAPGARREVVTPCSDQVRVFCVEWGGM